MLGEIEALDVDQETQVALLSNLSFLTATMASACVDSIDDLATVTGLGRASEIVKPSINIVLGTGVAVATMVIEDDWEPELLAKELISVVVSSGVGQLAKGMGFAVGGVSGFALFAGVGYGISKLIGMGYNNFMDGRAIIKAQGDAGHLIKSESILSEFLDERWGQISTEMGKWTLVKDGHEAGLALDYTPSETEGESILNIKKSGESTLRDFYNNGTEEHKKIIETFLEKLGEDFNIKVTGPTNTVTEDDHVFNMINKDVNELINDSQTDKATLWAIEFLEPFVLQEGDKHFYDNSTVDPEKCSEQYIKDRSAFLYYRYHPEATVSNFERDIDFTDKLTGTEIEVDNGMIDANMDRQYWWGTDGGLIDNGDDTFGSIFNTGDDHLYESSPKAFSPHRAVFSRRAGSRSLAA